MQLEIVDDSKAEVCSFQNHIKVFSAKTGGDMAKYLTSKEIGFRLRQLRQLAGLSQEKLAEIIGISTFQLQKYETGQNMMNTDKLQRVADALSVPVQALFSATGEYLPIAVEEKLLLDYYRAINNKQLQESCLNILSKVSK